MKNDAAGGFDSSQPVLEDTKRSFHPSIYHLKTQRLFMHLFIRAAPSSREVMNILNAGA